MPTSFGERRETFPFRSSDLASLVLRCGISAVSGRTGGFVHLVTVSTMASDLLLILPPGFIHHFTDTFVRTRACSRFLTKRRFSKVRVLISVSVSPSDRRRWSSVAGICPAELPSRGLLRPDCRTLMGLVARRPFILLFAGYPQFRRDCGRVLWTSVSSSFYGLPGLGLVVALHADGVPTLTFPHSR